MTDAEKVIQRGIIMEPTATKNRREPTATAGAKPEKIVFFARPFTFGERLLYLFVKQ